MTYLINFAELYFQKLVAFLLGHLVYKHFRSLNRQLRGMLYFACAKYYMEFCLNLNGSFLWGFEVIFSSLLSQRFAIPDFYWISTLPVTQIETEGNVI